MNKPENKKNYILFIDSGIGGLSTLAKTCEVLHHNYIYFADNKFAPYGDKTDEFLLERLSHIIKTVTKKYSVVAIVLACNTATTSCIKSLRKLFPDIKFIGTEPAYKTATDKHYSNPAIIATPRTIEHLSKLGLCGFDLLKQKSLAKQIEDYMTRPNISNKLNLLRLIFSIKTSLKSNDCLILGCTHYVFIKTSLLKLIKIPIIEGNAGVAKQVAKLVSFPEPQGKSRFKIILSQKNKHTLQKYKKILKQILANQINLC